MGGIGSGRRGYGGSRNTVEDHRFIDVRRWRRDGLLRPGNWFSWRWSRNGEEVASISVRSESERVVLSYRLRSRDGSEWESIEEPIPLDTTPGTYGGNRVWFRCPLVGCGRRVALLYLGRKYFGCRQCYGLAYASTREADTDRWTRRADKLRERLGWEPGILNGPGGKPKWMRWRTFERLSEKHEFHVSLTLRAMARRFGGMGFDI